MKRIILTAAALAAIFLTCCRSQQVAEYRRISTDEAIEMMTADVIVLDVRTPEEFEAGHIENAVLIPDYDLAKHAETILTDKEQTILVYCRTGRRSEIAAISLIEMGYTKVYDFGGIVDWTEGVVRGGESND